MSCAARRTSSVLVIGGGVIGCSIAYHLARSGIDVRLIEKHAIAAGASGASAGGVRHQGRDLREFPLAFRAIPRWTNLDVELGTDIEYRRGGHLTTIEDPADFASLTESVELQRTAGLEIAVVADDDLRQIVPNLSRTVLAGAYSPSDGHAHPGKTTAAFAQSATRLGAIIETGITVTEISMLGGRVAGVLTDSGPRCADVVVLAVGAWSVELTRPLGIHLPLEAHGFQAMSTEPAPMQLNPVMGSIRRLISLKQVPNGRYLLGGGWPGSFTLDAPRGSTISESREGNYAAATGIFPPVAYVPIAEAWLGIEAVAIDEVPIIGPVAGIDGLIVATGFSGHGFALSPAVGDAVTQLIASGIVPLELRDLALDRFSEHSAIGQQGIPTAG